MSDPSREGFHCCGAPMMGIKLEGPTRGVGVSAWLCLVCGIWRHALPYGDARRAAVKDSLDLIVEAQALGSRGDAA